MLKYKIKDKQAYIDGVNLFELEKKYGSPLYVISYSKLKENINEFKKHFLDKYDNVKIRYAAKANLSIGLAKILKSNNFGIDVVSIGELFVAKQAGIDLKNVEFNGNNKTDEDIDYALTNNIGYFVVDNENELSSINEIAKKYNKVQKILFRVTPNVAGGAHHHISTGQTDSKFGIPTINGYLIEVFKKTLQMSNIEISGLHFHIGSQLHTNESHLKAIDVILEIAKELQDLFNYKLKILNIGGGFGIDYTTNDHAPSLDYYFNPIMNKIDNGFKDLKYDKRPEIIIEPGRYIIGEAGFTLYKVGAIKTIPQIRKYISVNGGMADNLRPALYEAKYHAIVVNKIEEECNDLVTLAGNCCETGDIIIKDILLPKIDVNDVICVFSTGAYGYSMANNYNKNRIPATLLIENAKVQELVKRQSFEDLIRNDCDIEI